MRTTKCMANAFLLIGLLIVIGGFIAARSYQPRWSPPGNGVGYELLDTTGLERFIMAAAVGFGMIATGSYLHYRGKPLSKAGTNLRRWGLVLILFSILLYMFPVFGSEGLIFLLGLILVIAGWMVDQRERRKLGR